MTHNLADISCFISYLAVCDSLPQDRVGLASILQTQALVCLEADGLKISFTILNILTKFQFSHSNPFLIHRIYISQTTTIINNKLLNTALNIYARLHKRLMQWYYKLPLQIYEMYMKYRIKLKSVKFVRINQHPCLKILTIQMLYKCIFLYILHKFTLHVAAYRINAQRH